MVLAAVGLLGVAISGCGGGSSSTPAPTPTASAPTITTTAAQQGAEIVSLGSTTSGAVLYYTLDGTTPSSASQQYQAPFLVASNLTVKAIATAGADAPSSVTSQTFTPNIPSGTLVWSDEFSNVTSANAQPNPLVWTYDTGNSGFGNSELENYCAWGSNTTPCSTANPNAYVGTDGYLHIVAEQPLAGVYTSARMKTLGLFSFQYGRIEASMKLPESQGMWPAFWLLGNIDGSNPENEGFDWVQGSIHGTGLSGGIQYHPSGFSAAGWHTYGMIWTKGQIQYYVDNPSNVYATYTSSAMAGTWPFDAGPQFLLLNLAVGGSWPGSPDATTVFPSEVLVDYVRLYTN
jgi:beta-glucanase (GH16 family)